jgi:hypothetical protein
MNRCLSMSALALGALLLSDSLAAQTCAAPATWHPDASGNPSLNGSTCGHETGIISVCQNAAGAPGQAFVTSIFVAADAGTFLTINFVGGPGYTLSAYLVPQAGGCNNNAACTTVGDGSTPILHTDVPPGTYYLILTGADFDAPNACGTFTVLSDSYLPVTLQTFSVD